VVSINFKVWQICQEEVQWWTAEKEPAMNKTIWYGAKNNAVRFSENEQALVQQGIDNPQQFTVNGEVTGLNLIGDTLTQNQNQSGAHATA
jgi:hypothetical protein